MWGWIGWIVLATLPVAADDFVAELTITAGDSTDRHRVIFASERVFAATDAPDAGEVVHQTATGTVLLDVARRAKTTLATDTLDRYLDDATDQMSQSDRGDALGVGIRAVVEANVHRLSTPSLAYQIDAVDAPAERVTAMADYTRRSLQLNLVRRIGPPPLPRLTLNESLRERGRLPVRVWLTTPGRDAVRATIEYDEVSEDDRRAVARYELMLATFQETPLQR